MKLADRLKQAVQSENKEEKNEVITEIGELIISENKEENMYLINKTLEILNIQAKASLELGKIFNEVIEKVEENTYCKWLEINGYNRTTAFRHRRRHTLYGKISNEKGKELVALCSYREIDKISKEEDIYLNILESDITYLELKERLKDSEIKKEEVLNIQMNSFKNYGNIFKDIDNKLESLDQKNKKKVQKHLEEIDKILNKNK